MTGLKANFQILPWYEISYHVVRNGQSEQLKIEYIILLNQRKKSTKICIVQKLYTHNKFNKFYLFDFIVILLYNLKSH